MIWSPLQSLWFPSCVELLNMLPSSSGATSIDPPCTGTRKINEPLIDDFPNFIFFYMKYKSLNRKRYMLRSLFCNGVSFVNRKYLEDPCVWVESNVTTLNILSSQAEIGLGFLLIISIFSSVSLFFPTFKFRSMLPVLLLRFY